MFTGIIEQTGQVVSIHRKETSARLSLRADWSDLIIGESIAVNGVCLTLLSYTEGIMAFDISPETLMLTTLGQLQNGDCVNLERAMPVTGRFGGHYVSGHVDATVQVSEIRQSEKFCDIQLSGFDDGAMRYLLPKGSLAVDGVSLTINAVHENSVRLMLIPHTLAHTTFSGIKTGQRLNVEYDYFARIVVHQLESAGMLKDEVLR